MRTTLTGNKLKPHLRKMWCIPPTASAEFVYHMEDVLDVYHRPSDPLAGWREGVTAVRTNWAPRSCWTGQQF